MRRRTNGYPGRDLAQAIALLVRNEAAFWAQLAKTNRVLAQSRLELAKSQQESGARFGRIERELEDIKAALLRHDRILADLSQAMANLPEVIRQKSALSRSSKV